MKKAEPLFDDNALQSPTARESGGIWRGLLLVALIFLMTRAVVWTATYCGAHTLFRIRHQLDRPYIKHEQRLATQPADSPEQRSRRELLGDFAPLCRMDGAHYQSIVEEGYAYAPPPEVITTRREVEQNIAFFPLFPQLVRPLTAFMGTRAAMILLAHVCGLAAAIVLYLWVRWRINAPTALLAVAVTFCWPPAAFYSFAYAESVTLLLMVSALWLLDRRAFVPAAVLSGLCTATRPTALAISAVFVLAHWFNSGLPRGPRLRRLVPLALVSAGGIISYAIYLTVRFGSPLVYFANFRAGWVADKQRATWLEFLTGTVVWERFKYFRDVVLDFPAGLTTLAHPFTWNMPLSFFILFLCLAGLTRVPRSFRPLLALGPLIFIHSYLASGGAAFGVEPIARYMLMSVPAFVVLAAWCRREWPTGAWSALLSLLLLLQAAWAFRFGLLEWSG
jgi:hypothetical protein